MGAAHDGVIGFAHRGARAECRDNTLESFARAVELGAAALESDVWRSADGVAVLDHDGVVRAGLRRRPIASLRRAELPAHIPELADLYRELGTDSELSLDVKDPAAAAAAAEVAARAGAPGRLWLCGSGPALAEWRRALPAVRLVDSTRRRHLPDLDAHAGRLREAGVDAINMPHPDWDAEAVATLHRHGLRAFAWDLQRRAELDAALALDVDGVYSDHVARMVAAIEASRRGGRR